MTRTRRSVLQAGCGVLAGGMLAGCVGNSSSGGSDTETGTTPLGSGPSEKITDHTETESPTTGDGTKVPTTEGVEPSGTTTDATTPGTTTVNRGCDGARNLGFKFYSKGKVRATRRSVVVGDFGFGANAHVLLVAYEGDTVLGVEALSPPPGVVVEGESVPFKKPLTGEHTIRVVMYADEDGDGKFEPEHATPCRHDGKVIQAGPKPSISVRSRPLRRLREFGEVQRPTPIADSPHTGVVS